MVWREAEERYLKVIEASSLEFSKDYHSVYFQLKVLDARIKIPAIIIGSFTGVASFGSSTFPKDVQKWIAITVGLINVGIAMLNTLETFFKLGEHLNHTRAASEQFRKLSEDINKELALEESTRQTTGIIFLREVYTRYQQIVSNAPMLSKYKSYLYKKPKKKNALLSFQSLVSDKFINTNNTIITNTNNTESNNISNADTPNYRFSDEYKPSRRRETSIAMISTHLRETQMRSSPQLHTPLQSASPNPSIENASSEDMKFYDVEIGSTELENKIENLPIFIKN
jgi:hypothetical protein